MTIQHTEATIRLDMTWDCHDDCQVMSLGSTEIRLHDCVEDGDGFDDQHHYYHVVHNTDQAYPNYGEKYRTLKEALATIVGRDAIVAVE